MWERIQKYHVIHVRATPASGKSTLSRLLMRHVKRERPGLTVKWCTWPTRFQEKLGCGYDSYSTVLSHLFEIPPNREINWLEWPVVLIIDEAQESYDCENFWNGFIKSISPTHPCMVILFSSWGSATSKSEANTATPVIFEPEQRISIRPLHASDPAVFFTYAEFLDVVERLKIYESRYGQAFLPDKDVIDYIWELTNGHPSATRVILSLLAESEVSILMDTYTILTLTGVSWYRRYALSVKAALR